MTVLDLLNQLNSVMGTKHKLRAPGLQDLLEDIHSTARDFGEAYGMLRPRWSKDSPKVLQDLEEHKRELSELREGAVVESSIETSYIPPRRVWDLYSNRVLPFHILPPGTPPSYLTENLWTVSHAWAADNDRVEVLTNINGKRWPVPLSDVLGPASSQQARPSRANSGQAKPGHRHWLTMAWWPGLTGRKPKPSQKAMAQWVKYYRSQCR